MANDVTSSTTDGKYRVEFRADEPLIYVSLYSHDQKTSFTKRFEPFKDFVFPELSSMECTPSGDLWLITDAGRRTGIVKIAAESKAVTLQTWGNFVALSPSKEHVAYTLTLNKSYTLPVINSTVVYPTKRSVPKFMNNDVDNRFAYSVLKDLEADYREIFSQNVKWLSEDRVSVEVYVSDKLTSTTVKKTLEFEVGSDGEPSLSGESLIN